MNARIAAQVAAAKTADLVHFYNLHAVKQVTKFADRATAEKRLLAEIESMVRNGSFCPHCADILDPRTVNNMGITPAGAEGTKAGERFLCHHCDTEYHSDGRVYNAPAANTSRSAAIASSWCDARVRELRSSRIRVAVHNDKGQLIDHGLSVAKAFRALGLPMSKHIAFRGQLRDAGELTFAGYTFSLEGAQQ